MTDTILPNGLSKGDFEATVTEYRAAIGTDNVIVKQSEMG